MFKETYGLSLDTKLDKNVLTNSPSHLTHSGGGGGGEEGGSFPAQPTRFSLLYLFPLPLLQTSATLELASLLSFESSWVTLIIPPWKRRRRSSVRSTSSSTSSSSSSSSLTCFSPSSPTLTPPSKRTPTRTQTPSSWEK